jgi:homoserine/homoserine lactone efflux protein
LRLDTWTVYTVATTTFCVTPGPAVLYTLSQSLRHGWRRAIPAVAAIQVGSLICFAISAPGIGALLLASHRVFLAMKWAGAIYLVVLGVISLRRQAEAVKAEAAAASSWRPGRMFIDGVVIQLANPNTFLFFVAFLPQFVDASQPTGVQMLILAVTDVVADGVSLMAYAVAGSSAAHLAGSPRFARAMAMAAGVMLIVAGAGVALVPQ